MDVLSHLGFFLDSGLSISKMEMPSLHFLLEWFRLRDFE